MKTTCPTCNGTGVAGRIPGVAVPVVCTACHGSGRTETDETTSPGHYEPEAGFVL